MRKFLKYVVAMALLFIALSAFAQDKTQVYYDTHESEILPDAQAAFQGGRYDRAIELCKWYYVILGNDKADAIQEKASQCMELSAELNELLAAGDLDRAKVKAEAVLALNPDDSFAKEVMASFRWVDLGLPSGTLWKEENEKDFMTYKEAVNCYGESIPSKDDIKELRDKCKWEWNGSGYTITGPNGHSIILPAAGWIMPSGSLDEVGDYGSYWSSTRGMSGSAIGLSSEADCAWSIGFDSEDVDMYDNFQYVKKSVRLVSKQEKIPITEYVRIVRHRRERCR